MSSSNTLVGCDVCTIFEKFLKENSTKHNKTDKMTFERDLIKLELDCLFLGGVDSGNILCHIKVVTNL